MGTGHTQLNALVYSQKVGSLGSPWKISKERLAEEAAATMAPLQPALKDFTDEQTFRFYYTLIFFYYRYRTLLSHISFYVLCSAPLFLPPFVRLIVSVYQKEEKTRKKRTKKKGKPLEILIFTTFFEWACI